MLLLAAEFVYNLANIFTDFWIFGPADDFIFYDHDDVSIEAYFSHPQYNFFPAILNHVCEIHYTPSQYNDIQNLSEALNHLASTQRINPLSTDAERLRLTLSQALNLHTANIEVSYNFFTSCYSVNNLDPRLVTNVFDFARLTSPEFQILLHDLGGILLQYMNTGGLNLQNGFYVMNRTIERFLSNTPVNIFVDHPLLNVEPIRSPLLVVLSRVVEWTIGFFF